MTERAAKKKKTEENRKTVRAPATTPSRPPIRTTAVVECLSDEFPPSLDI